ncbi:BMH1 [Symbiodinium sp. CCMP2456]|nr:BMH1 [Symbiodinium sp. CCMP2456]
MTEMDGIIREHEVYFATLAEQAERYDEMAEHMRAVIAPGVKAKTELHSEISSKAALFEQELDAEERNLLAVAFKQAVGQRRVAWRIVCAAEQEEQAKGNHMTTASARGYRKKIEAELTSLCQTILALLTDKLIPGATTAEAKVSYYKAQGDYYRYMAEISDDMDRTRATTAAKAAYEDGTKVAETSLKVTSPFRLGRVQTAGKQEECREVKQCAPTLQGMEERGQRTETIELEGSAVRVFVNLDVTSPGPLKSFLRKVGSVALVAVFAVRRRTRLEEGKPFSRRAPGASLADLRGGRMQRGGRSGCFQFQTETTSEVAADALLTLLYSKHAGPRNYLISSATERERQQCFRELLCLDESKKTIWLSGTDFEPQKLYKVMNAPTEAVRIGRKAFEDAVREIDNLGEDGAKESALVMQLLRDNITLWTAAVAADLGSEWLMLPAPAANSEQRAKVLKRRQGQGGRTPYRASVADMARAAGRKAGAGQWKVKEEAAWGWGPGWGPGPKDGPENPQRQRVQEDRCVGLITEWRGYMGWIAPIAPFSIDHDQASKHWGLIYVTKQDLQAVLPGGHPWMRAGRVVDFLVYSDGDGLGAEDVRALSPLRVTLTHAEARALLKGRPERSEYLTDSEQYPNLMRDLGVLVRKYSWPLPFVTLELWGHVEDVAAAALEYCSSAGGAEHRRLQLLLPEDKIAQVEDLPGNPKVSTHAVVQTPVPCRSLVMESSAEDCRKAVVAFLRAMEGRP